MLNHSHSEIKRNLRKKLPRPSVITTVVIFQLALCRRYTLKVRIFLLEMLYKSDCEYDRNNPQSFMLRNGEFLFTFAIIIYSVFINHRSWFNIYLCLSFFIQSFAESEVRPTVFSFEMLHSLIASVKSPWRDDYYQT